MECWKVIFEEVVSWPWDTIIQAVIAVAALATLWAIRRENRRNAYLPYINVLHEQLNDIIISLYHLFNNPNWETKQGDTSAWEANYKQQHDDFLKGHRYFVISSIPIEPKAIQSRVKNAGRRKMYFNELRNRYVRIYEALLDAAHKSNSDPLSAYFALTEYDKIYKAYKDMKDLQ